VFGRLSEVSGRPMTTLRVAVSDYLGKALLVPVVRGLLDRGAPLRFEIATTHSREAIRLVGRGEVEFGIVTAPETPRGLEEQHLFDQPFVWVGPPRRGLGRAPLAGPGPGGPGSAGPPPSGGCPGSPCCASPPRATGGGCSTSISSGSGCGCCRR